MKLGAGGLRDLDVARWTLAALDGNADDEPLRLLALRGALDTRDVDALGKIVAAIARSW